MRNRSCGGGYGDRPEPFRTVGGPGPDPGGRTGHHDIFHIPDADGGAAPEPDRTDRDKGFVCPGRGPDPGLDA